MSVNVFRIHIVRVRVESEVRSCFWGFKYSYFYHLEKEKKPKYFYFFYSLKKIKLSNK